MSGSSTFVEIPKTRLVARGFRQIHGKPYYETYPLVLKFTSIRCQNAISVHSDPKLHEMDVVTAFSTGELDDNVYMGLKV